MKELTYHNSLQSKYQPTMACTIAGQTGKTNNRENLLCYYLPSLAPYFPTCLSPRPAPLANRYVKDIVNQSDFEPHSLLEKLLRKGFNLEVAQAAAECKDHIAAGIDTTGDCLCWLMWELSQPRSQAFQRRMQNELATSVDMPLDGLVYLDAVIKESLRCFPPIPMSLPRYVPRGGREISGHFIPAHTIVSAQPYSVHRLNETIFPDPDRFFPDRWLDDDGAAARNRLFFAFATGGRGCAGKKYATALLLFVLC